MTLHMETNLFTTMGWQAERQETTTVNPMPARSTVTVSVVVPALNEAENLPHVLPRIPKWVHEIILVDGHSVDGTAEVAVSAHKQKQQALSAEHAAQLAALARDIEQHFGKPQDIEWAVR